MSSAVALSEPSIDSRLLAGSATSCSSEAHACGVMSLPCKWQRRRVLVWASDADLEGSRWWGCGGAVSGRQHGGGAASLPATKPHLSQVKRAALRESGGLLARESGRIGAWLRGRTV